uniref:Uncharacterized protein n=1 Tax=Aotus nancymaae TaxID=37293 RepID=A0A2K5CKM3_AOTNA
MTIPLPSKTQWLYDFVSIQERPWYPHIHSPSQHLSSSPDLLL